MEHINVGSPDSNTNECGSGFGACTGQSWLARKMRYTSDRRHCRKPRIPKVPQALRDIEDHNKCFDPVVLSIGPYHHGKDELEMVQNLKIACAKQFVSGCDLNNFCRELEVVATTARDYYDWSTIERRSEEDFTWMMFLDGCFILHFIDFYENNTPSELDKHINILPLIWRDLFLLENQLPFVVLKALMSLRYTEDRWKDLNKWIDSIVCPEGLSSNEDGGDKKPPPGDLIQTKSKGDGEDDKPRRALQQPLHLLDLLHTAGPKLHRDLQQPLHLLDLLRTKLLGSCDDNQRQTHLDTAVLTTCAKRDDQTIEVDQLQLLHHIDFRETLSFGDDQELRLHQSIGDGGDDLQEQLLHIDASFLGGDQQPRHHLLDFVRTEESNVDADFLKTHSFGDNQEPQLHQSIGDGGEPLLGSRDNAHTSSLSRLEYLKWRSYPSINELITVGINIKRSNTSCLNDIHFRTTIFGGELLLPQLVIDNYTREKFLNLVAYEKCKDKPDLAVSSYLCFMDTLIDDADDVKKLRSKRILYSWLGTNEQVADHFNKLAVGLVPDANAYSEVIRGIDKYYKSKIRVYIGQFVHSHFTGPWSIIATIAAGITILLTFFQTISSLLSAN